MSFYLPPVQEFSMSVLDRGAPNLERIALQALRTVQMEPYCLVLSLRDPVTRHHHVLNDHIFWFGSGVVQRSEWILIYTGPGNPVKTTLQGREDIAYVLHWNKQTTILSDHSITPLLMKFAAMTIGDPPKPNLPQLGALTAD